MLWPALLLPAAAAPTLGPPETFGPAGAAAAPVGGSPAAAAVEFVADPAEEEAAVRKGADLERGRRWVDAIGHYEAALERFPENEFLKYGLRRSKIHFGIERRYVDGSYERNLLTKAPADALRLFEEIFDQVRTHYVDPVSVTSFTAHGTESLYLALANDKFLRKNVPTADPARVARLRQTLRERYWNRNVEGAGRARAAVEEVCRLCRTEVGLADTAVVLEYVFGGCNALDDYSNYLTPDRLDDLYGNIEGEFVGLGIEMKGEEGRGMLLVHVLPESPAAAGGMRPGEYIVAIDGRDCRGMSTDEAARLLRGPSGSTVDLELAAPDGGTRRGRFARKAVVVHSVEQVQMIAPTVGYLRMTGFQKNTAAEMDAALADLKRQGMKKLVWDLRGNPGGLLTAAVEVLDRFIADGVLVSTKGRSFDQNWTYSAHRSGTHADLELVLLVDGDSASASEIVAGAVRDHKRGTIVGQKTYGKWSVQSIMPVRDRTGLRLTTAKFYSPNGHNFGKVGVKPDLAVPKTHLAAFRPNSLDGILAEPEVQAALGVLTGQTVTSR